MQFVIPIYEKWTPENIVANINQLRSQMNQWKNFKLTYDELTYEKKGYFVINFSYDIPERKASIHIWRDKVETTSKNWRDSLLTTVILSYLLREGRKSIFLDSIYRNFKETGECDRQFQELYLEAVVSQYLDLIEGKVPRELVQNAKDTIQLTLENMLGVLEEIK